MTEIMEELNSDDGYAIVSDEIAYDEFAEEISEEVLKELEKIEQTSKSEKPSEEVISDIKEKKKRKKREIDPFITFCKSYFSSMMARTSKYVVFNLDKEHPYRMVCLNNRQKITFEDFLLQYHPGDLSIQVVDVKDTSLVQMFKDRCLIDDEPTLINLNYLRKALSGTKKYKEPIVPIFFTKSEGKHYLRYTDISVKQEMDVYPTHNFKFGLEYTDWRTLQILRNIVNRMTDRSKYNCVVDKEIDYESILQFTNQNLTIYPIPTHLFTIDGKPLYPDFNEQHNTILIYIDGRDIVSVREWLKKKEKDSYSLTLTAYVTLPDTYIYYQSTYMDDNVQIISSRPYTCTYPFITNSKELRNQ